MLVGHHCAWVVVGGKDAADQFSELDLLRSRDLDDTIDRFGHGGIGHCSGHVNSGDRLQVGRMELRVERHG